MSAAIALVTSIPPRLPRYWSGRDPQFYQDLCVHSWLRHGFRVMSLNPPEEIGALCEHYPDVHFVAAQRDASAMAGGRKLPYIADMLALAADVPEAVLGVVNSDILFDPAGNWAGLAEIAGTRTVLAGQRYETKYLLGGALHQFIAGFDYFFFDRSAVAELAHENAPFAIGLPWWDYWLPLTLELKGWQLQFLQRPAGIHLAHESATGWAVGSPAWRELAWAMIDTFDDAARARETPLPPDFSYLMGYVRELIGAARRDASQDERLIHLANICIPLIWRHPFRLDGVPAPQGAPVPPDLRASFEDFEDRALGGASLHEAIKAEKKGDHANAEMHYRAALQRLPRAAAVIAGYGSYLFRLGRIAEATEHLQRAAALVPDSTEVAIRLAAALSAQGRGAEAAGVIEQALEADPLFGPSYYTYALLLADLGRAPEALARFERVLAEHPGFPEAPEWRARIAAVAAGKPPEPFMRKP